MQKLKCELCGSIDIVKTENDMFQCQACGCKYTLEQAKSIISGVVETTIGNSEFNRLVSNAETQIKLGNDEALSTTDLIMKEYPNRYQGYWLFMKCIFSIIKKRKTIKFGYYPYKSKYDGLVHTASLDACKKAYTNLLQISEVTNEITIDQINNYWETNIQAICQGIINGEIDGLNEESNIHKIHPSLKKLYEEGESNKNLLLQHNLCMHFISKDECEWFLNFGKPAYSFEGIWQPEFLIGKKIVFFDSWSECHLFYRTLKCETLLYPIKNHISEITEIAKENVKRVIYHENKCPKCMKQLHKTLFGKLRCSQCDFSSSIIDSI